MDTINIMLACDSALFTEEHIAELTRDGDIRVLEPRLSEYSTIIFESIKESRF